MNTRYVPFLLLLVIIVAAILSRFIANSDAVYAQIANNYGYKFFYCPYNNYLYRGPKAPYPYRAYPTLRYPLPYSYPYFKQHYPCPCNTPALNLLLQDDR